MAWRRTAVAAVALLALVACGSAEDSAGSTADAGADTAATETSEAQASSPAAAAASTPAPSEAASTAAAPTVAVTSSDLGDILVDGAGRTLYVFDNDTSATSTCYDDCAANWPALTGQAQAGEGADASLLGTSEREDGATQVTYADHPLYYFAGDGGPGETNGQGVGGIWWVVAPDGSAITDETASADGY
jgi:predicted lipoprotein with Yx(FWY)xxD motif